MKFKSLASALLAALALMAFASTASATTLEIGGVKQAGAITIHATAESTMLLAATGGGFANTCPESTLHVVTTTPFSGTRVGGPLTLTVGKCTDTVSVDTGGYLEIEWISGTTNGTLFSKSARITSDSPFGYLDCTTSAAGTDIGSLTGKVSEHATLDINAVLNCGFFLPSAKWEGTYWVTTPTGLGVTS